MINSINIHYNIYLGSYLVLYIIMKMNNIELGIEKGINTLDGWSMNN